MDEALVRSHLDSCLATDDEIKSHKWEEGYEDSLPIERAYAIE